MTDRDALLLRRCRAQRRADHADAMFLHHSAIADVQQRLSEVNRTFTKPAVVTGFPELWQTAVSGAYIVPDDEVLALDPRSHDLVIHAMSLHWANDPLGQMIQCLRALQPDGLFLGILPGGRTLHELRASLAEAEVATSSGLSPRVVPMAEIRDLGGLLQRAGFALPVADNDVQIATYPNFLALLNDLRAMGETNALTARLRQPTRRTLFARAATVYSSGFGTEAGRIPATFELIFLTGWAPHEGQQKPLRPGSAQQRLSDALHAAEQPLPRDG